MWTNGAIWESALICGMFLLLGLARCFVLIIRVNVEILWVLYCFILLLPVPTKVGRHPHSKSYLGVFFAFRRFRDRARISASGICSVGLELRLGLWQRLGYILGIVLWNIRCSSRGARVTF